MKEFCNQNSLSRGRTNHNIGKRVIYLTCAHEGCNAKSRLVKKLDEDRFILETVEGFEHQHDIDVGPGRGLSPAQKAIALECFATGNGAPKKVSKLS